MKFGYTVVYVADVAASLQFFNHAFGFDIQFIHESGTYGELATGDTVLAFAAVALSSINFAGGVIAGHTSAKPLGVELAFTTSDVATAHIKALKAGAQELAPPKEKPWGQVVSFLRCPDGTLVELCTPMNAL